MSIYRKIKYVFLIFKPLHINSVALARKRTIQTERPRLVGENLVTPGIAPGSSGSVARNSDH
jgi:hypothetical protein